MKAFELKKDIYWVGAIDWAVRDFHGYEIPRGTSYNNYLIMDEEITLIDTVKFDFSDVTIKNLVLTEEDFADIRNIQPLVLTEDRLWNYETKFRGDEKIDDVDCWVLQVRPRQILQGQRFFDGMIWVDKKDYNIVRMEGQAVPQIRTTKSENLFPRFTTIRKPLDGKHWFPVYTYADDTLQFRTGPQRIRLRIAYSSYKRFGAESTLIVK